MRNIAIIPARSGSKGLKDKNIKLLNGKPLLAYSIEAAVNSKMFDAVMVSTDSRKYADVAKSCGAEVPFLRSAEASSDTASSWDMVREVLANYRKLGKTFDTVCLLQPTSPLRLAEDISRAYDLYVEKQAATVVAVCESDHSPLWMNILPESLSMDGFIDMRSGVARQMNPTFYRINGAVYIVNVSLIEEKKDIYTNSYAYVMPKERSVDIDTEYDFKIARCILLD